MSGETANFHARYLYRDYLQVAECDLTGETPVVVRSYIWDPSEPEATRVLSMTRWEANGTQEKEHLYCNARRDEKRHLPLRGSARTPRPV